MIPASVLGQLREERRIGDAEPMLPLLTVDPDGFPRVCMLSRGELWPEGDDLVVVLAARRASANLERSRRATLLVVEEKQLVYVRLAASGARRAESGVLVARLVAEGVEEDGVGVPLHPMTFTSTQDLAAREHVDQNRDLVRWFLQQDRDEL